MTIVAVAVAVVMTGMNSNDDDISFIGRFHIHRDPNELMIPHFTAMALLS